MSAVIVTLAHVRKALPRRCSRGLRSWCALNGVDWADFVRNGIDADILEQKGGALLAPVIELARAEVRGDGR